MCATALRVNVTEPYIPWRLRRRDMEDVIFKISSMGSLNAFKGVTASKEVTQYLDPEKVSQCSKAIDLLYHELITTLGTRQEEIFPLNSGALIRWVDLLTKSGEESSELRIERKVIGTFERIEQVFSIYTDEYLQRKRFLILTMNENYDDELMNLLLINERNIRLQFRDIPLSFEYIPKLVEALGQVLNPNAKLIWARSLDGISTSSFATSTT